MGKIECRICGKEMHNVSKHLRSHEITKEEYLLQFPRSSNDE